MSSSEPIDPLELNSSHISLAKMRSAEHSTMCYRIVRHNVICDVRSKVTILEGADYITATNPYETRSCPISCDGDHRIAKWFGCEYGHRCCFMTAEIIRCSEDCKEVCKDMPVYHSYTYREGPEDRETFQSASAWESLPSIDEHISSSPPWGVPMLSDAFIAHREEFLTAGVALHDAVRNIRRKIPKLLKATAHLRSSYHEHCRTMAQDWCKYRRFPGEYPPSCCDEDYSTRLSNESKRLREKLEEAEMALRCQTMMLDFAKQQPQDSLHIGLRPFSASLAGESSAVSLAY